MNNNLARSIRRSPRSITTWADSTTRADVLPQANRQPAAPLKFANARSGQITRTSQRIWRRSLACSTGKGNMPSRSRSTSACWRSSKRDGKAGDPNTEDAEYEIAINLNNLAALYNRTGRAAGAEPLYRRALEIKEKLLGAAHPDVAVTLNNLAVLCKAQGRLDEAAEAYRRAWLIFEQTLDAEHPKLKICRENYEKLVLSDGQTSAHPAGRDVRMDRQKAHDEDSDDEQRTQMLFG